MPINHEHSKPDIFVGGAMRSGTTLAHQLVCTAPDVNGYVAEAHLLRELVAVYKGSIALGEALFEPFFANADDFKRYFAGCVEQLLATARERHNPGGTLALKNPELTMYFPELSLLQPDAQFILVIRDPRDCVASMSVVAERATLAGEPLPMGEMADGIEGMAVLFLRYYANVITSELIKNPQRLLTVRYEDLVTNQQKTLARLCLWSGLDIDPDAIERPDAGDDGSIFGATLYGEKISDDSIGGFAKRLSADDIAIVERTTRNFMQFYGYEPHSQA